MFNLQKIIIGLLLLGSPTICTAQGKAFMKLIKQTTKKPIAPIIISEFWRGVTYDHQQPWRQRHPNPHPINIRQKNPQGNIIGGSSIIENSQQMLQSSNRFRRTLDSLERERKEHLYKRQKQETLEEYRRAINVGNYTSSIELIKLAEKCAYYGLEKESADCLEKYVNFHSFRPTEISSDISQYEEINKQFKTNRYYSIIPRSLTKAMWGVVFHIYNYRNELFALQSNYYKLPMDYDIKNLKNESLVLNTLAEEYAKDQLGHTKLISTILDAKTEEEKYFALENAAKSFVINGQDSTVINCGKMITNILIEYAQYHPTFSKNILDLFEDESFAHYTKNNLGLTFTLFIYALENADQRSIKYYEQGHLINQSEFDKLYADYFEAQYNYLAEHPEDYILRTYLFELSNNNTDFLLDLYTDYWDNTINKDSLTNDLYLDEATSNYRDALVHITQLGDSLTKENGDSTLNLRFKYLSAVAKMAYQSSAIEGRKEIASLYAEITNKGNGCNDNCLFLEICRLHGSGLFYGEGKEKEAYKILKPLIDFIENECTEPGLSESMALNDIITYSNKLGKKRTAKKAQKLMNKLFPNNSMETSPNTTI